MRKENYSGTGLHPDYRTPWGHGGARANSGNALGRTSVLGANRRPLLPLSEGVKGKIPGTQAFVTVPYFNEGFATIHAATRVLTPEQIPDRRS